jgi:hypothetical protein
MTPKATAAPIVTPQQRAIQTDRKSDSEVKTSTKHKDESSIVGGGRIFN